MSRNYLLSILVCLVWNVLHSQSKTPLTDSREIDKKTEYSLTFLSLGWAFFNSEVRAGNEKIATPLFTPFVFGVNRHRLSYDFHFSSGELNLKTPVSYLDNNWNDQTHIQTLHWGGNFGYQVISTKRVNLRPLIGFDFNSISQKWLDLVHLGSQNGRILVRPVISMVLEYRFLHLQEYNRMEDDVTVWGDRHFAIVLRADYLFSPHNRNLGLNGDRFGITFGLNYTLGNYRSSNH